MGTRRRERPRWARDRDGPLHSMFWVLFGLGAALPFGLVLVAVGVPGSALLVNLWVLAVMCAGFVAAEVSGNKRVVSSDRLVDWIYSRDQTRSVCTSAHPCPGASCPLHGSGGPLSDASGGQQ